MRTKQDFPMMIYHPVLGTRIVKNEFELSRLMVEGWTKDPKALLAHSFIKEKIAFHRKALEQLESELIKTGTLAKVLEEVKKSPESEPEKKVIKKTISKRPKPK